MEKEKISNTQAIGLAAFFLTANAILTGDGKAAGEDIWISVVIVMIVMIPLSYIYRRIVILSNNKGIFTLAEETMGKFIGRALIIPFLVYSMLLGTIVLRSFSEFLFIVTLTKTPQYITLILLGMLCIWAAKSGIVVIARWARFVYPIVTVVVLVLALLCIPLMDLDNLRSILFWGPAPMLEGVWNVFAFPMIEAALLIVPFCRLENKKDTARVYIISFVITAIIIIIVNERNILVLGDALSKAFYFPSYEAVGLVKLGNFFDRLEILKGMVYVTGGFLKAALCLYIVSQGFNSMLGLKEGNPGLTAPLGLLMIALAGTLFSNYRQLISWVEGENRLVSSLVLGIIPIIIWITAEMKIKLKGRIRPKKE